MASGRLLHERGIDTRIPYTVDENGVFTDEAPGFEGKRVLTDKGDKGDANEAVIRALIERGDTARARQAQAPVPAFLALEEARHLPQHAAMVHRDGQADGERALACATTALKAIGETRWVPADRREPHPRHGQRQARLGDEPPARLGRADRRLREEGRAHAAARRSASTRASPRPSSRKAPTPGTPRAPPRASSQPDYDPADYEKVDDILDVWFDSGSTHAFVLEDPMHFPGLAGIQRKLDGGEDEVMYLEGSDQHRGWFQSSLLESCGTRGRAPFDIVLTHGFTLDEKGRKKSKSLGNQTFPQDIIKQSGADILRLWVASADYSDDQRIGPEILKMVSDNYRKLRNSLRWMLGTLAHYDRNRTARVLDDGSRSTG